MASDDNDPRRNRDRPEDNPFVAFRRFADSQVSSLFNTVFTLPATIAKFKNIHIAREQCLFGRADKEACKNLQQLEEQTAQLLAECRELYRMGDLELALEKIEHLVRLNYAADVLRAYIVEKGSTGNNDEGRRLTESSRGADGKELIEKLANEKGQQWGWSWDWGFPRPFNAEDDAEDRRDRYRRWCQRGEERGAAFRPTEGDNGATTLADYQKQHRILEQQNKKHLEQAREHDEDDWDSWSSKWDEYMKTMLEELSRPVNAPVNVFAATEPEAARINGGRRAPSETDRLTWREDIEKDGDLKRFDAQWRDAFEDLVRVEKGLPLMAADRLGQSNEMSHDHWARRFWDIRDDSFMGRQSTKEYPKRVPWEGEETTEEPSYEYSHDHEDQHDEPPTPKVKQGQWSSNMPETEMEAYERLLGPAPTSAVPHKDEGRPSILSTLTTTERTVAPDGTVTTKVVLKNRFTDGREESSETVHTQRGQETEMQQQGPWKAMQDAQATQEQSNKETGKKSGWFWSN